MTDNPDFLKVSIKPKILETATKGEMPERTHKTGIHSSEFHAIMQRNKDVRAGEFFAR